MDHTRPSSRKLGYVQGMLAQHQRGCREADFPTPAFQRRLERSRLSRHTDGELRSAQLGGGIGELLLNG
jgi:hypothetical protein